MELPFADSSPQPKGRATIRSQPGEDTSVEIMAFYVVFVVIGDAGAYLIGRAVELWSPTASLPAFLAGFFVVFWIAWQLAMRVTKPKAA
jgi:integral membrane sensor domain MASE1